MQITELELVGRLILAGVFGAIIGLERERKNHSAGLRTYIAVVLGSTLVMLISIYGFTYVDIDTKDPARLAAQVVSGIGFLGAGTIIVNKNRVRGLTTAASLWTTACIGLAVGAGMYIAATATTLLLGGTLSALKYVEHRHVKKGIKKLSATVSDVEPFMAAIEGMLIKNGVSLEKVEIEDTYEDTDTKQRMTKLDVYLYLPKYVDISHVILDLSKVSGICSIRDASTDKKKG